ncbi:U4/U6 small nuclear ribonucleoprotein Prp3-like [Tubulanus polymorphus]|uniref:U4/U6 small nuclear ribonucleoprotein Prp3-like n=1 Tax=Tubulanus polymorphus TaxID=672921 RepID=UPI003DA5A773
MSLSRKDLDVLKPEVNRAVQKFLGFSETTLVTAAINCVDKGYDKRKTRDKLSAILDEKQAAKFTDKLFDVVDDFSSSSRKKSRKRKEERGFTDDDASSDTKKKRKFEDSAPVTIPEPGQPSPGQLTADKIKEMMANAQKMIQERKAQIQATIPQIRAATLSVPPGASSTLADTMARTARLQQQIASATQEMQLRNAIPKVVTATSKPAPVILDDEGRTIDASTGEAITLAHHMPTLKANIRAKRREEFKQNLAEKLPEEVTAEAQFFDNRVSLKSATRTRRLFKFHDAGKFQQVAQRMRTKAQLEKLQQDIAQAAKKTGIASAAKLATIQPKHEIHEGEIPDVEWWDSVIMRGVSYNDMYNDEAEILVDKLEGITFLVEHPAQMKPPAEPEKVVPIPVILTKQERKKLRRQNRTEAQKDVTEKIRLGLMPPPEPKVRMANLMRVLGTEAVQDPTKIEAHVRAQMAKRQKLHEETNAARKLTPDQRREKKLKKIREDTSLGIDVAVYRIKNLSHPSKKFKVEQNCIQLLMTGFVVLYKDCNVVAVEGGPKQQKKFRRLMMHRIKWEEDKANKDDVSDDEDDDDSDKRNKCHLVWTGQVKHRSFGDIKFKACPTETFAREQFKKHGVQHYWDLAFSGAILEAAGEEVI